MIDLILLLIVLDRTRLSQMILYELYSELY